MRLIDADEAYKVLEDYYHVRTEIQHKALKEAFERVPTVDIDAITESHEKIGYDKEFRDGYAQATSEVKHGRWKQSKHYPHIIFCDECGEPYELSNSLEHWNYCPNCGVKMDEVKEKEFTLYAVDKPIVTFKDSKIVLHGERKEDGKID